MRKLHLALMIVIFASAPGAFAEKTDSGAQNITSVVNTARYILFGGTYTISGTALPNGSKTADRSEPAVFKLDTYTGKAWILRVEKSADRTAVRWIPVEDAENIAADNSADLDNSQKNSLKTLKTLGE